MNNISRENCPSPDIYVRYWKWIIEHANIEPTVVIEWDGTTYEDKRLELLDKLNRRIAIRGGLLKSRGRCDTEEYYYMMIRDRDRIRDHIRGRRISREFETKECKQRFSYMLTTPEDE